MFCHLGQSRPALQGRSTSTGAVGAFHEAPKGPWWLLQGNRDTHQNRSRKSTLGRYRTGAGKRSQGAVLALPEGQEPSWTSVCRDQSPVAMTTPSMGNLQPVSPGLTGFQGAGEVTSPLQDSVSPFAKLFIGLRRGHWMLCTAHTTAHSSQNAKTCRPQ